MNNNTKGYYDFDVDFESILVQNSSIDEVFYIRDLKQRKLYFNADVDQFTSADICRHILQFNAEDKGIPVEERKPITLYVTSNGGSVVAGFEIIDIIKASKTPVYTVNLANEYSMGFLIGLAGHKRYAMNNATFLMHDGSNFVYDSGKKAQDTIEFNKRMDKRIKKYILENSNLTEEEYDAKERVEWYMFADEAKKEGFVDYIIGVDCELDEVI